MATQTKKTLDEIRKKMDDVDARLVKTFLERMDVADEVAAYKRENNLPVLDKGRERDKVASVLEMVPE